MCEGGGATQHRKDEKATLQGWPALAVTAVTKDRFPGSGVAYNAPPGYRPGVASTASSSGSPPTGVRRAVGPEDVLRPESGSRPWHSQVL